MTDQEKFVQLMKEFDVPLDETKIGEGIALSIEAHSSPKVKGYAGFVADFKFDNTGRFIQVGIWE